MEKITKIPDGVQIDVKEKSVTVKGPKGSLNRNFSNPIFDRYVTIEKSDNKITVKGNDRRKIKSFVGAIASHIENMALGVTKGYTYKLKIFHTHFPITMEVKGKQVIVKNFLGERSQRIREIIGATKVEVKKDEITVTGIDKEAVSQTAGNIEGTCRLPGKDRRIFLDGIYITGWKVNDA